MVATSVIVCFSHTDPNLTLTVHFGRSTWLSSNPSVSDAVGAVSGSLGWSNLTLTDESLVSMLGWSLEVDIWVPVVYLSEVVTSVIVTANASKSELTICITRSIHQLHW